MCYNPEDCQAAECEEAELVVHGGVIVSSDINGAALTQADINRMRRKEVIKELRKELEAMHYELVNTGRASMFVTTKETIKFTGTKVNVLEPEPEVDLLAVTRQFCE